MRYSHKLTFFTGSLEVSDHINTIRRAPVYLGSLKIRDVFYYTEVLLPKKPIYVF